MSSKSVRDHSGYLAEDTIAAIATAVGGAISIVRVSGPGSREALRHLTSRTTKADPSGGEARKLQRVTLRGSDGRALDDALAVLFVNPESFTGEDLVELHLHGGAFTALSVMEALSVGGVRQALPGEFSFRAVRNGKLTLAQAQAVADLVAASNESAVSLALEKLSGAQNRLVEEFAGELRTLVALGEAGIDFSDQDLDEVSLPNLRRRLVPLAERLRALSSSYERGVRIQEGVAAAFVGLPNAGKSSFFNSLLGEDRSIVSEIAGTTRDVIREKLTLRGNSSSITLRLEDTAGLRKTSDVVEREGVARTRASATHADIVLLVVDPGQPFSEVAEIWRELRETPSPGSRPLADRTFAILTKSDLAGPGDLSRLTGELRSVGIQNCLEVSSRTGEGVHEAARAIAAYGEKLTARSGGELLLTRLNQVYAARAALLDLDRAAKAPELELFAADLRQALHTLTPLIGQTVPDDILGKIFSEFCIGK